MTEETKTNNSADHPDREGDAVKISRSMSEEVPPRRESKLKIDGDVALRKTLQPETIMAHPLWIAIRNRSEAIGFKNYIDFLDKVFCDKEYYTANRTPACGNNQNCQQFRTKFDEDRKAYSHIAHGVNAYELLKVATQIFLLLECGIVIDGKRTEDDYDDKNDIPPDIWRLPYIPEDVQDKSWKATQKRLEEYLGIDKRNYIQTIINNVYPDWENEPECKRLAFRADCPCMLELIWNYWIEECGLTQALKVISLRFQNRRNPDKVNDPLVEMEITPLRPINNFLWGYIQDEQHRLSVPRRVYEYDHHYGLTMFGKAVPKLQSADSRSKFIEAFHYLLNICHKFMQEEADMTVNPDPFPVLNALKEVNLLLSEGAHNQYGDLPWTSRVEMLIQQYLLDLPEMREFLRSRTMVAYPEGWMGPQDAMKRLQGWSDVSSIHFSNLAIFGERLLLSIRYGNWIEINDPEEARVWVRYWQQEIQGYIHAYRVTTGADLSNPDWVDTTMPAILLRDRLIAQKRTSGSKSA